MAKVVAGEGLPIATHARLPTPPLPAEAAQMLYAVMQEQWAAPEPATIRALS